MGRKEDLLNLFKDVDGKELLSKSIDDVIFLEEQLEILRNVPHIKYHPKNKDLSKRTEAGKMYKEYLQQYNGLIKNLISILNKNDVDVNDSPLRIYFNKLQGKKE